LPNRGPPSGGLAVPQAGGLAVPIGTATKTPNPRQKVLLKPGHSPLDWANLQKSGKNLSGVDRLIRVTPSMLKHYNGRKGRPAWSVYQGKVYNISPYLPYHPGGEGELRRAAGKDGEKLFMEVHPWVNWENMLGDCLVGIMVTEHDERASTLDDMD
jgi:cytochrome b involved in lipid metabolism